MNKAVFLDRDGVINKVIFRNGNTGKPIAPWSKEEFSLIPDIKDSLFNLKNDGFKLFVVTNQPDIAKGIIDNSFVVEMNEIILKYLPIDEIRFCPHSNMDECDCRKPKPGMILGLADKWNIDCQNSFLIGDSCKDIEAGKKVGVTTFLLKRHYNKGVNADHKVTDLSEAVKIIQNIHRHRQA